MATDLKNLAERLSGLGPELNRIADLLDDKKERQRLGVDKEGKWPLFQQTLAETENVVRKLDELIGDFDA